MYQEVINPTIIIAIVLTVIVVLIISYSIYRVLQNPFQYPYFTHVFDVSYRKNVDMEDYIDRFLCNADNWNNVVKHQRWIEHWKNDTEEYLQKCILKKRRIRQYQEILDDEGAFHFESVRGQTRYKQKHYIKTAYKVSVFDSGMAVSWNWLLYRYDQLAQIGFQATLKEFYSQNQRKMMNRDLRKQIMERDNYTCQICGKYMPDEVGLHIDHIIPIAKGGKTIYSNLQVLCSKCNGHKGVKY